MRLWNQKAPDSEESGAQTVSRCAQNEGRDCATVIRGAWIQSSSEKKSIASS